MENKIVLNQQQKQAVKHKRGPLLIIAGAGTGKTTVITSRVQHLIENQKISPQNILAVTFSDKAAAEMLERLDIIMPLGYEEPWLGTFHAICDRILKTEGLAIGLDPSYKIITPVDQWILIKNHLFDFNLKYYRPLGNPAKFISALIKFFSRLQDEDIDLESFSFFAQKKKNSAKTDAEYEESQKITELVAAFKTYQKLKTKQSVLDFPDLITKTLELFRQRKSLQKKYQHQFQHILVDEFQDTNYAQYQLIKLLAPASLKPNLVVVGDDDQAVYKFRGAAISNILDFKKDYPKAKEVVLSQNYRSLKPILNSSYHLIQYNNPDRLEVKLNINKKLKAIRNKKPKELPLVVQTPTGESEVDFTIKKILELAAKENYSYKDFAILTRANSQLDPYVTGLKRVGLPYQLIGNRGLFDQEEVRNLIHFLRVIANPENTSSLFHFLHFDSFQIPAETIVDLINQAKRKSVTLWSILKDQEETLISSFVKLIISYQTLSLKQPITKLLHQFILETDYIKDLANEETVANQLKINNLNLFFNRLQRYETENKNSHVIDFVDMMDLWQEAGENPAQAVVEDIDTLSLLTIHSAKGLEFPVVFVGSLVAGRFPTINRRDPIEFPEELIKETLPEGSGYLEEERRLLYVAMTRAKDYLYLTYSPDYSGIRVRKKSGFLEETKLKEIEVSKEPLQLSLLASSKPKPPTARYLNTSGKVDIRVLSYSQIDTFNACPLRYKYRYILKVPAEPHHALSFGQTIHNTLHDFHRLEQQGKILPLEDLLRLYKKHFVELGYQSDKHKNKRRKAGEKALRNYYKVFPSLFGKPKLLERNFRLKIANISLIGKIDRIDETQSGDFEIIDYKTGASKDQKTVDKDRQLTIYGLAAKEVMNISIAKMSLYFVESGEKVTTQRNMKDYIKERKYLEKTAKKMQTSKLPPKPGFPFPCNFCEYNKICPYARKQ